MNAIIENNNLSWKFDVSSPWVIGFSTFLGLQLTSAVWLNLEGNQAIMGSEQAAWLHFTPAQITQIHFEGNSGAGVVLKKSKDNQWVIPALGDFPGASNRVDELLNQLAALKKPLPIAQTEEAQKRFKVADSDYQRRLILDSKDGQVVNLLIGDSPGFRRLYARLAGDSGVYDLRLSLNEVANLADEWVDKSQLRLEQDKIERIASKDWALHKLNDGWQLENENSDAKINQTAVNELLGNLANLGYRGVLGTEEKPEYQLQNPKLNLTINLTGGINRNYLIGQIQDKDNKNNQDYVLKDAARPYFFKLSQYDLQGLLDLDLAKFKVQPPQESAKEPAPSVVTPEVTQPAVPSAEIQSNSENTAEKK